MSKIFAGILLSKAQVQLRSMVTHLTRAESNFLTEKSIDRALADLQETRRLLELAKENYLKPSNERYSSAVPLK
jgi:hypothetical protein